MLRLRSTDPLGQSGMRRSYLVLLGVVAVGASLRLYALGAKSLWYDEAVSANFLDFSALDVLRRSAEAAAVHPPIYFLLLHPWAALWGESEFALRSLATVFGLLTIVGIYALVEQLERLSRPTSAPSGWAALSAAALVALSPMQIHLSQQVRGYTLALALTVWGGAALIRALRSPARAGTFWLLWALLSVGACYTHHLAAISVVSPGLFAVVFSWSRSRVKGRPPIADPSASDDPVLRRDGRRPLAWALVSVAILVAGYVIPWAPRLVAQSESVRHDTIHPLDWREFDDEIYGTLCGTFSTPPLFEPLLPCVVTGLLITLWISLAIRGEWSARYLLVTGLFPVAMMVVYSCFSTRSILVARYYCFAQISWLAALAILIATPPLPLRAIVIAWTLGLFGCACSANWQSIGPSASPGLREASLHIRRNRAPGEPVVAMDHYAFFGFAYYLRGSVQPRFCVADPRREVYRGSEHLKEDDLITPQAVIAHGPSGLWTISHGAYRTWKAVCGPELSSRSVLLDSWSFKQDNYWEQPIILEHYIINK
jgi:hypothetical protein